MPTIHLVFHDGGGGHRNAATALREVMAREKPAWRVELVHLQDLLDPLDVLRRVTGLRIQECYNAMLRNGWTLGSTSLLRVLQGTIRLYHRSTVRLLEKYWRAHPADMAVSLVPHFNRALREGFAAAAPGKPFVTILTDLADFPPHFWIERQEQYLICGTERAVEQARALGHDDAHIFRASGMILKPDFYAAPKTDREARRRELGLETDLPTAIVLFGGHGSKVMLEIAERLDSCGQKLQAIFICGRNERLAARLRARRWRIPVHIKGFTTTIFDDLRAADLFIGKPGPGSISESLAMGLPVIIECNSWTLPQERYNAEWVRENQVGIVLRTFRELDQAVAEMLQPERLSCFRARVAAQRNRAVFEIPEIMEKILARSGAS
jgi:Glycosyltransferase family 28 C-terminal domain